MVESNDSVWLQNMEEGQGHSSIEIIDDELVSSIKQKLENVPRLPSECCIYRVHDSLRAVNERAYVPQLVSIGPYHHGKENLKAMEKHKWLYLKSFMHRSPVSLEDCVQAIRDLEQKARRCYAETISLSRNVLVEMLLVDGCFLIELFLKYRTNDWREKEDPIFNTSWMLTSLNRDLMLLENQIPFSVLECLFILNQVDPYKDPFHYLTESALGFFSWMMPTTPQMSLGLKSSHLLELLRNSLLPSNTALTAIEVSNQHVVKPVKRIPCAMTLRQFGIKFKKGEDDNLCSMKFSNGVLEIPPLTIQDLTEPFFRNLIAFEQCHKDCTNQFTSYASLMDSLISNTHDVALLHHHGIIDSWLGNYEDVSLLFNKLCAEVNLEHHYHFFNLSEQVNAYCKSRWHEWVAALKRDYFNNPWAILSFVAAILIITFTFTQTLFSILSYSPTHS
ncbi:hypothetical protein IFM89_036511 [Coptis chinensis]|uniref:Uncharacterized protein n=1 Tax=Coptis chinensis TaxID=261450 RepID=A0A835I820_9MAGN|nr:hypothetical protein IFM89_036511 [Coptis chinensis]